MYLKLLVGVSSVFSVLAAGLSPECDSVVNCIWCPDSDTTCLSCAQGLYLDNFACVDIPDGASTYNYSLRRTKLDIQHDLDASELEENFYRQFLMEMRRLYAQYYGNHFLDIYIIDRGNPDTATTVITYQLSFSNSAQLSADDASVPIRTQLGETGGGWSGVQYYWFAPLFGDLIHSPGYSFGGSVLLEGPFESELLDVESDAYSELKDKITYSMWYIIKVYRRDRVPSYKRVDSFIFEEQEGRIKATFAVHFTTTSCYYTGQMQMTIFVTAAIVEYQGYMPGLTTHRVIDVELYRNRVLRGTPEVRLIIEQNSDSFDYTQLYLESYRRLQCAARAVTNSIWSNDFPCKLFISENSTIEMVIFPLHQPPYGIEQLKTFLRTLLGQSGGYLPYHNGVLFTPNFGELIHPEVVNYRFSMSFVENEDCIEIENTESRIALFISVHNWVQQMSSDYAQFHFRGMSNFTLSLGARGILLEADLQWSKYASNINDGCYTSYKRLVPLKSVKYFTTILTQQVLVRRGAVLENNAACVVEDVHIDEYIDAADYVIYKYSLEMDATLFTLSQLYIIYDRFMGYHRRLVSNAIMENMKFEYRSTNNTGCFSWELRMDRENCCTASHEELGESIIRYLEDRRGRVHGVTRRFTRTLFGREMLFPNILEYKAELNLQLDLDTSYSEYYINQGIAQWVRYKGHRIYDVACLQGIHRTHFSRFNNSVSVEFWIHWSNCSYDTIIRIPWQFTYDLTVHHRNFYNTGHQVISFHVDTSNNGFVCVNKLSNRTSRHVVRQ